MQDVAGNSEAVILDRLTPGTQYSIAITAVWLGKKYRSRQVIFRTLGKCNRFSPLKESNFYSLKSMTAITHYLLSCHTTLLYPR